MRVYKLWDLVLRKLMYSRDVIFREVGGTSRTKEDQMEKEPEKMVFKLRNEENDSNESIESNEEVEQPTLVVRRYGCIRKPIERYNPLDLCFAFVLSTSYDEPKLVREVVDSTKGKLWKDTMVEEIESLHNNEGWDFIELPNGRKLVSSKCVFKKNLNEAGQVNKSKAQLVAKGYSQVKGVQFSEILSSIAKLTSIRVLMSLVVAFDFEIEKMDMKTLFLHGDLEEETT
jgi:hypothetical protein